MTRPNFLIIGSQKAGTTSLYHVLRQHPQIYLPPRKEINFFFHDHLYRRGLDWYAAHFADRPPTARVWGEASPGYICHPAAPRRIAEALPQVKLILTVRHPVRRAYSQYWDNRRHLSEPLTFAEAADRYLEEDYQPGRRGYFSRAVYIRYIRRYLDLFPRENLLVLVFEDLQRDPAAFYRRIFRFLGVEADFQADFTQRRNASRIWRNPLYRYFLHHPHATRYLPPRARRLVTWGPQEPWRYPPLEAALGRRLLAFYRPWNAALAEFLQRSLDEWEAL